MASEGSSQSPSPLSFTRRSLEANSRVRRTEIDDVHPHRFYRYLCRELEGLREEGGYEVVGERSRDLRPEAAGIGQHTGVFTGRAQARAEVPALGEARITHRPWGPHGAVLVVLGLGVGLFGLLDGLLLLLAALLVAAGVGLFGLTREAKLPLRRRDVLSVFLQGEARERRSRTPEGHQFELAGEVEVVYAAEAFLIVDEDRVPELPWPVRAELSNRCDRWQQPQEVDRHAGAAMGFVDALRAWAQLDGAWTQRDVELLQRGLRGSLAVRQAYTDLLAARREADVRASELARVDRELSALHGRMRARAEHAAATTNGAGGLSRPSPQLEVRRLPRRGARPPPRAPLVHAKPARLVPRPRRKQG